MDQLSSEPTSPVSVSVTVSVQSPFDVSPQNWTLSKAKSSDPAPSYCPSNARFRRVLVVPLGDVISISKSPINS